MNDLERAVINAAMKGHRGCAPETCGGSGFDPCSLGNAIEAYLDAQRPETVRGALLESEREERQHLTAQLSEYALGVLQEWMRIIELEDASEIQFQARLRWHDDGTALIGATSYSEEYGRFRFTVHVEDLGVLPPLGPEDDPALQHEQEDAPRLIWVTRTWDDVRMGDVVRMPRSDAVATIAARYWPATDDHRGRNSMHVTSDGTREKWAHTKDRVVQEGECCVRFTFDPPEHTRYMIPTSPVEIQMEKDEINALNALGWANRERTVTS